jgi:endoglucanase
VIVGPARMNDIGELTELELPDDDRVVVTVHYYAPLEFTHQGRAVAGRG